MAERRGRETRRSHPRTEGGVMLLVMTYFFVAAGFADRGRGFWRAVQWPTEVGGMLADMCDKRKGE